MDCVDVTFLSVDCTVPVCCESDCWPTVLWICCEGEVLFELFISFMTFCLLLLDGLTFLHTLSVFFMFRWFYAWFALFSLQMKTVGVLNTAIKVLMMIYTTYKGVCVICICSLDQVAVLQTVINDREKQAKHSQALHAVYKGTAVRGRKWGEVTIRLLLLNPTKR